MILFALSAKALVLLILKSVIPPVNLFATLLWESPYLSSIRIRNMEDNLLGATGKEEEKLRRAIEREKIKTEGKIKILEEKLKYVGTYSLDAICLLDVI